MNINTTKNKVIAAVVLVAVAAASGFSGYVLEKNSVENINSQAQAYMIAHDIPLGESPSLGQKTNIVSTQIYIQRCDDGIHASYAPIAKTGSSCDPEYSDSFLYTSYTENGEERSYLSWPSEHLSGIKESLSRDLISQGPEVNLVRKGSSIFLIKNGQSTDITAELKAEHQAKAIKQKG